MPGCMMSITELCYWIYDDGRRYATHSVMVPRINDLRLSQWLDEARELVARVETPAC